MGSWGGGGEGGVGGSSYPWPCRSIGTGTYGLCFAKDISLRKQPFYAPIPSGVPRETPLGPGGNRRRAAVFAG